MSNKFKEISHHYFNVLFCILHIIIIISHFSPTSNKSCPPLTPLPFVNDHIICRVTVASAYDSEFQYYNFSHNHRFEEKKVHTIRSFWKNYREMAQPVVGFVGLDEVSLKLAASLLQSGYSVQAFEVCSPPLFWLIT